ncbi:hypothetical protein [Salsipaludibacter albus]|uniref:hypothetical protein n=1 Tax=Salsipaludibacter albus TaxID=2849650 RepID=UPI001EE3FAC4|nr:hypothetical protein [Salsipaludibacter albus]MBY5161118.1 hypothetical protein [Salsipaludibacter albus]
MDVVLAAHSGLRWLVLAGLVAVIAWAFTGDRSGVPTWVRVVGGIFALQVVLGLVLYVADQGWEQGPFLAMWHPVAMIAALGVFQVGTARAGRGEGPPRVLGLFTLVALVLVLAGIPWFRPLM